MVRTACWLRRCRYQFGHGGCIYNVVHGHCPKGSPHKATPAQCLHPHIKCAIACIVSQPADIPAHPYICTLPHLPCPPGETYYFKVNGWPVFAKGANMMPLRVVQTAMTKGAVSDLIQHAVGANMNMIRVWGGGHYQVMLEG